MAVTPFSGVSGFGLPVAALAAGAPLVFAPAFDEESSLADIREHRVTHTHANHEILRRWLAAARGPEDFGVLKLSGFMTSPAEIEAMIASHSGVAGCQVVGVATERGTRAAAFVVPADGAPFDEAELIAYCTQRMARYKVPLRIFAIDEFPLTAGADAPKVRKTALRKIAEARLGESRIREKS